ncbi:MAG: hypothetical protein ACLQI7_22200 [Streptosporangiaceae bacterium]
MAIHAGLAEQQQARSAFLNAGQSADGRMREGGMLCAACSAS